VPREGLAARDPARALEQRFELLRLRAAAHRMELTLARQELEDRYAGLRRGVALVARVAQVIFPLGPRSKDGNSPWLRLAALLGTLLLPLAVRPLWRWMSGDGRRRRDAGGT
jgi:hypothetical protein